jgi:hypothetical protein
MTELTRRELQALTGLPTSTLTRQLSRFPMARSGRGRFTTADPGFAAWVARFTAEEQDGAELETAYDPPEEANAGPFKLPSGVMITCRVFEFLRSADEPPALALLDQVIGIWHLRPHHAVPDRFQREALALPSGTVVNAKHWRVLRGENPRRAAFALDVLIRSWGVRA